VTTAPLPLRFQIGARALASIQRQLIAVPLSLEDALEGRLPLLPPLDRTAHGYRVTSLPEDRRDAMVYAAGGMIGFVRERYTRRFADLAIGLDAWLQSIAPATRAALQSGTEKVASVSGGCLDIRRFRTPDEMTAFHDIARRIALRSCQERLLGGGLPDDSTFLRGMYQRAAADSVRGWLLHIAGEPAAYLYVTVDGGIARRDHAGHDPAFSDLRPDCVLQLAAMRDLFAAGGLQRFDFTEGDSAHKRQFATGGVDCIDMLLLRASLANRLTTAALGALERTAALGRSATRQLGLGKIARAFRR